MEDFWYEYYIINYYNGYKFISKGRCCIGPRYLGKRPGIDWYVEESTSISTMINYNVRENEISQIYPPKLPEEGWEVYKIERITEEEYEKICKERGIFSPKKTGF